MNLTSTDRIQLRDLTRQYAAVAADPVMNLRRATWRRHNSLKSERPLIYLRAFAWAEQPESQCQIADPFWRQQENTLRRLLYWSSLNDDSIFEPWLTVPAVHACEGWGVAMKRHTSDEPGGSFKIDYAIREPGDLAKLRMPRHAIDEQKTTERVTQVRDVLGDILTINLDRSPAYRMWTAEISSDLGNLRGSRT